MPELRTKTFSVQLKIDDADPEGTVYARFATLNVIDHDGDVIRPKAVGKQKVGAGLHNHGGSNPTPAGYGDTYEEDAAAYARLTYITDTWAGRETYTYLKAMADAERPVEWSMRYYVKDGRPLPEKDPLYQPAVEPFGDPPFEIKKMVIIDVDPVSKGAGIDTATVAAKECGPECQARQAGAAAPTVTLDGPIFDYERLGAAIAASVVEALGKAQASHNVKNVAVALMLMLESFERHLTDLSDGWLSEEVEVKHKNWVPLSSVTGTDTIPPESARVIKQAVDTMMAREEVGSKNRWQALEYWAADYLAGE